MRTSAVATVAASLLIPSATHRLQAQSFTNTLSRERQGVFGHCAGIDPATGGIMVIGGVTDPAGGNVVDHTVVGDTRTWFPRWSPERPIVGWSAMVRQIGLGALLLYGGKTSGERFGFHISDETWEWTGSWRRLMTGSPPGPRYGHAMAFDEARGVTVLWGGSIGGDTRVWEWNGTAWTPVLPLGAGPADRRGHAMAFDPVRRTVLLFGGFGLASGQHLGDTWEWTGSQWAMLPVPAGPDPRANMAMVTDVSRRRIVLFGGRVAGDELDQNRPPVYAADTWTWDGSTWKRLRPGQSPSPRAWHSMTYIPSAYQDQVRIVLVGGMCDVVPNLWHHASDEVWEFRDSDWSPASQPPPRRLHSCSYDPAQNVGVLFGGIAAGAAGTNLGDTWLWNGHGWARSPESGPPPRFGHALVNDPVHQETLLIHGASTTPQGLVVWQDIWARRGSSWTNISSGSGPSGRFRHACVLDPVRQRIILHGGTSYSTVPQQDTWEYDCLTRSWSGPFLGPAAIDHGLVFDRVRGRVLLVGGTGGGNAIHEWVTGSRTWTQIQAHSSSGPLLSSYHAAGFSAAHDQIFVPDGSQVWSWSPTSGWMRVSNSRDQVFHLVQGTSFEEPSTGSLIWVGSNALNWETRTFRLGGNRSAISAWIGSGCADLCAPPTCYGSGISPYSDPTPGNMAFAMDLLRTSNQAPSVGLVALGTLRMPNPIILFGNPACSWHVDGIFQVLPVSITRWYFARMIGSAGIGVPADPLLVGQTIYAQGMALPCSNCPPPAVSAALQITFGSSF